MSATVKKVSPAVVRRRERWLAALESDRYAQGTGKLRRQGYYDAADNWVDEVGYCCLGVACKVLRIAPEDWTDGYAPGVFSERLAVPSLFGDSEYGYWTCRRRQSKFQDMCAGWNDTLGLSFKQIAARLRQKRFFGPDLDRVVTERACLDELERMKQNHAINTAFS